MKRQQWAVYGKHLHPLFKGSKTEVLKFLAYVMADEVGPWRVERI